MTHLTFLFSENSNIYPKNVDCNRPPPFPCKIIIKQINNSIQDIFLMGFKFEQYVYFLVKNTLNFYLFQQSLYTIKFVLYIYIYLLEHTSYQYSQDISTLLEPLVGYYVASHCSTSYTIDSSHFSTISMLQFPHFQFSDILKFFHQV